MLKYVFTHPFIIAGCYKQVENLHKTRRNDARAVKTTSGKHNMAGVTPARETSSGQRGKFGRHVVDAICRHLQKMLTAYSLIFSIMYA